MISYQPSTDNRFQMQFTQNTHTKQHPSSYTTTYTSRPQQTRTNTNTNIRLFATMNDVLYTPVDGRKCSSCGDRKK
jgi:hypothetical protein